jgi:hypothetical protein
LRRYNAFVQHAPNQFIEQHPSTLVLVFFFGLAAVTICSGLLEWKRGRVRLLPKDHRNGILLLAGLLLAEELIRRL